MMEQYILEIRGLVKEYKDFSLQKVDLKIPYGCIAGLAGENGAGKTTLIKSILSMLSADQGEIFLFGKEIKSAGKEIREQLGVVLGEIKVPGNFTALDTMKMLAGSYRTFDRNRFEGFLTRFKLEPDKKVKEYSRGMKVKLAIAAALSHDCRLLLLDEPLNELDPVTREEVLELILEFMLEEGHSVLISSHLITDMEKIADYVAFIKQGGMVFFKEKDWLLEHFCVVKGSYEDLMQMKKEGAHLMDIRKHSFGAWGLLEKSEDRGFLKKGVLEEPVSLEEILISLMKEDSYERIAV